MFSVTLCHAQDGVQTPSLWHGVLLQGGFCRVAMRISVFTSCFTPCSLSISPTDCCQLPERALLSHA